MAADPFSIIGLASSILGFIDFGTKVVSFANAIHHSATNTAPSTEELNEMLEEIQSLSDSIHQKSTTFRTPLSSDEKHILRMTSKSDKLAEEIGKLLETLKVRDHTALPRAMEVGRVAFRTVWKKKDTDSLSRRLEEMGLSLRECLNRTLQREQQSAVMFELRALSTMQLGLAISYSTSLDLTQNEILKLTTTEKDQEFSDSQIQVLKDRLNAFTTEYRARLRISRVIDSLHFTGIRRRWDRVPNASRNTNEWLFHNPRTRFADWLRSGSGIYWITGKAGSGKSTLMKFAADDPRTTAALTEWAGASNRLYSFSYYFWNQGFPLQKSQMGLLRTLLFQLLRATPEIVPKVCPQDWQQDDEWTIESLKAILQRVVSLGDIEPAKFCFFIDGLDEYHGSQENLVSILNFFLRTLNIKVCVSSRPRIVLDEAFERDLITLVISDFTKPDMETYVWDAVRANNKFQKLDKSWNCGSVISQIVEDSKGVWLWVFLVTRDLVRAVNRHEGLETLKRIVKEFPKELEEYFRFIIDRVERPYREEMAQIFLITIEEVQPLPLFIFSLLGRWRQDPTYAIVAPILPLDLNAVQRGDEIGADRLQNRCSDLLVVERGPHFTFLEQPVDFLHRTVRDFLRDCYYQTLRSEITSRFDPLVYLCHAMLYLLKGIPKLNSRDPSSITRLFKILDELLYYAYEAERRDTDSESSLVDALDEVDKVNSYHARQSGMRNHWTQLRDPPRPRGFDEYREGGNCNFLALTVQARLTKYVRAKLEADPQSLHKSGRPLLDYALRPRRVTPIVMPYHSHRDDAPISVDMVDMLLKKGLSPNQKVYLNDDKTVWALFLLSCYESSRRGEVELQTSSTRDVWYKVCMMMIQAGARRDCKFSTSSQDEPPTMTEIFQEIVGPARASRLEFLFEEVKPHQQQEHSFLGFSWFSKHWS